MIRASEANHSRLAVALLATLVAVVMCVAGDSVAQEQNVLCRVCPNPYQPLSPENLPPRDDSKRYMWVRTERGAKAVPNPQWKGQTDDVDPSQQGSGSDCGGGRRSTAAGGCLRTKSMDRSGVAYHRNGYDVFGPDVLSNIGGVLSQNSEVVTRSGHSLTVELEIGAAGSYPDYILVHDGEEEARYAIDYADLVPIALFVDSGGTSLYTLFDESKLPANFNQDAGFFKHDGDGSVALEFAGTSFASALHFLDTCTGCVGINDEELVARVNLNINGTARSEVRRSARIRGESSYINSDFGAPFEMRMDEGRARLFGDIVRFRWRRDRQATEGVADPRAGQVFIERAARVVRPVELSDNVARVWEDFREGTMTPDLEIRLLMSGTDLRRSIHAEAGFLGQRRLGDAFFLFESLVLLRAARQGAPEDWSVFMGALSSESLAAQTPAPWERYTENFCSVYPRSAECGE